MSDVNAMVVWLREQHDADEKAARDATPGPWAPSGHSLITTDDIEFVEAARRDAAHMARHDPRGTLARIEGERAILAAHPVDEVVSLDPETRYQTMLVCKRCREGERQVVAPCPTLRALAWGYRHRPGWQQGWEL